MVLYHLIQSNELISAWALHKKEGGAGAGKCAAGARKGHAEERAGRLKQVGRPDFDAWHCRGPWGPRFSLDLFPHCLSRGLGAERIAATHPPAARLVDKRSERKGWLSEGTSCVDAALAGNIGSTK